MNLIQLPRLLGRIAEIFERSGAKRQADGIRALKDVLSEEIASSGDAALATVQSRLVAHSQSKKRSARRPKIAVEEYVARLESLSSDADLKELLREFETGAFKKADLDEIAHLYAKGPSRYKSKAEAIRDIERRFVQRARAANELEYLEKHKVTPW
jgi:hypothetical protein